MLGKTISHYRILQELGRGGMGVVYKAEDIKLRRNVALKFLTEKLSSSESGLRQLQQEAYAASSINHPNICTVFDVDAYENHHFIAFELLEGQTLKDLIVSKPLQIAPLVELAIQIVQALNAAHSKGIIHRDIKPSNIFVTNQGLAKILDFGLAKITQGNITSGLEASQTAASVDSTISALFPFAGTLAYMSPEQARGEKLDSRSDLFSFGAVLYEMGTGSQAFFGSTPAVIFNAILSKDPPLSLTKNPHLSAELVRIIHKALEKDREMRYQSAADLCADLKRLKRAFDSERFRRFSGDAGKETESSVGHGKKRSRVIDSLAILPFVNDSADPNLEYLSDGITESIIGLLSRIPRLRVMATSTVFRFKSRTPDPLELGHILKVRAVLSGQLTQRNGTLLVKTELVDVYDGSRLWGEIYNLDVKAILSVHEEIAKQIADRLRLQLTNEQQTRLTKRYTESPEAYQLYLKGRFHWNKRTEEGLKRGIQFFQKSIEQDPEYALGYAGLADSFTLLGGYRVLPPKEAFFRGKMTAVKAIDIDNSLAEAHTSLALATLFYDWNWPEAEKEFKRAIQLNPNNPIGHQWYAQHLMALGRPRECLIEIRRAHQLDPLSLGINTHLGWGLYFARQFNEAVEQLRRTLELDPNYILANLVLGQSYAQCSKYSEAVEALQAAASLSSRLPSVLSSLGYTYALAGETTRAGEVLDDLRAQMVMRYVSAYDIALVFTGLGERDLAFEWLGKALEERSSWMIWLNAEPMLDCLRSDPRFRDLALMVGLPLKAISRGKAV
jgi:eukaryotic-like serine/threonine-protein kinase